ncbi:regulator of G-protein signaling 8 isoform X1 [Pantherophis guttatus]|uniref:Regulator of G-protein signaling 8 n=1 Tax=Pantherophis guttatus TaxID=94885 RepID=A0A6P9B3K8_PANGU|nr:regulator of G-protein signaling 8 isoform X1 [Pantherophis guttatus]
MLMGEENFSLNPLQSANVCQAFIEYSEPSLHLSRIKRDLPSGGEKKSKMKEDASKSSDQVDTSRIPPRKHSLSDHTLGKDLRSRAGQRQNRGMRTRLGCLSHKSDSCSDFTAILPDKPTRALKRLSTEEATRWGDSFDVLLTHKYGVAAFRAFLKTEFSEENLEFWLACEEFKKIRSTTKLATKAHRIFEEFIDVQAPREVNIDFQTREETRRNLEEPSPSCFDQAQGKIHSLMEKDSYPRFLRSKIYTDLLSQTQRRLS